MRRPGHAAEDGSFGKSAGMAAGRGAVLLTVAVVLGIVLLNAADDPRPDRVTAAGPDDDTSDTTTTLVAPTTTVVTVPLRPPPEVKVLAANATSVKGVARKVTDQLKAGGYNVLSPTDAKPAAASAVYFTGDYQREAETLAAALGLPTTVVAALPVPPPLTDARGANVVVLVGPELAQRVSGTTATTATATSTATTSTTTRP